VTEAKCAASSTATTDQEHGRATPETPGVRRTGKRVGTSWCKRVDINTDAIGSRHITGLPTRPKSAPRWLPHAAGVIQSCGVGVCLLRATARNICARNHNWTWNRHYCGRQWFNLHQGRG
jgi:hypothetical protein